MIAVGDKVVCINACVGRGYFGAVEAIFPNGLPKKGEVYVVSAMVVVRGRLGLHLISKPALEVYGLEDVPWDACKFRKLEDYRNEQELAYYRSLPERTEVHAERSEG